MRGKRFEETRSGRDVCLQHYIRHLGHTHARSLARTLARSLARTLARTHARSLARTHARTQNKQYKLIIII